MEHYNSFDKTRIYYKYYKGKLPHTLFFLHGWTSSSFPYEFLQPFLKNFHIFFWDARSHGKSNIQPKATIEDIARDFKYFLEHIYKLGYPITAIGHSMGTLSLLQYIHLYGTQNLSKMVVVDQSPKLKTDKSWDLGVYGKYNDQIHESVIKDFRKDLGEGLFYLAARGLNKEFNEAFKKDPHFFFEQKRKFRGKKQENALIHIFNSFINKDYRPELKKIDIPTLLLYGLKSQYYKKETAVYMKTNIKNSRVQFFTNGDHSPFFAHPEDFCKSIHDFVIEN